MARSDANSLWVARLMLRIGEVEQHPLGNGVLAGELNSLAGRVSTVDPTDGQLVSDILTAVEATLANI
jgi:hypothetical protein